MVGNAISGRGDFVSRWLVSNIPHALVAIAAFQVARLVIQRISVENDATIKEGIKQALLTIPPAAEPDLPQLPTLSREYAARFFYLDADNQKKGPVTLDWLHQSRYTGLLAPDTLVAKRGDPEWRSLDSIG